jgi:hypothetical protein
MRDDWAYDLAAKIVRRALADYQMHYTHAGIPDAGAFLRSAGLLTDKGLDTRIRITTRKGRHRE